MLRLKAVIMSGALAVMSWGLSTSADAQFEIAPDHFSDNTQDQAKFEASKHEQELKSRISGLQSELEGYQSQIDRRAAEVEAARRLADGAGGEGEFASVFIEEYLQQYQVLEQVKRNLAPLIQLAQVSIRELENELATNAPATPALEQQKKERQPHLVAASRKNQEKQLTALARR
jgi:peptidoglycan hydrolase CwlO-like protein